MRLYYHPTPVKVYKSTLSAIMGVGLYSAIIAFFVWVVVSTFSWIMVICMGMMAYFCVKQMVYFIRSRHEKIVITEQYLSISQCVKQTRDGDWTAVKNVKIPWTDINHISAQWEHPSSKSIRKNVLVSAGKKGTYLIDPDIFDVFFLEKKLQNYHRQYSKKRQSRP